MRDLIDLHRYNVGSGSQHESVEALPTSYAPEGLVRLIAFYLPQFHPIPENDEWWGSGFTEWNNVTRALPRFAGHQQPRLPADLGFYNLDDPAVMKRQVDLARRAGINGFCFHNYWFSGRTILDKPIEALLADPSIDMKFCIDWANENWSRRWDGSEDSVLLEQRYENRDAIGYADYIAKFLRDPRYIHVQGRPLILVYRPALIPDARDYLMAFRQRICELGFQNPFITMVQSFSSFDPRPFGLDAAVVFPPHPVHKKRNYRRWVTVFDREFHGHIFSYDEVAEQSLRQMGDGYPLFPGLVPSWDNEARKPTRSVSLFGHSPAAYGRWLKRSFEKAQAELPAGQQLVFINAWNEWAEGAYLEPDRHFGYGYLAETRRVVDALTGAPGAVERHARPITPHPFPTQKSLGRLIRNAPNLLRQKIFATRK